MASAPESLSRPQQGLSICKKIPLEKNALVDDALKVLEEDPWPNKWLGAVIPAEAIEAYSDVRQIPEPYPLICPFDRELLRAARYELRLGDEAHLGGAPHRFDENNRFLILKPHQVSVVKTHEYVRIPRFLIARWNLRVTMVYEGLLWVGGPQVDPGWAGHLYCPIYNLAEREIYLEYKQPIFTMDFVQVYPTEDKPFHARRRTIDEHDSKRLRSALFEELNRLLNLEPRFCAALGIMFVIFALIIAISGVIVASPVFDSIGKLENIWLPWMIALSAVTSVSLVLNLFIIWRLRPRPIWGSWSSPLRLRPNWSVFSKLLGR